VGARLLIAFAFLYGLLAINYIDLTTNGSQTPAYHLWLLAMYFAPSAPVVLALGRGAWRLALSMGLVASLANDLFYRPVGALLFGRGDLAEWYMWQLGLRGMDTRWAFNAGVFEVPVSSLAMGLSIYARLAALCALYLATVKGTRGAAVGS